MKKYHVLLYFFYHPRTQAIWKFYDARLFEFIALDFEAADYHYYSISVSVSINDFTTHTEGNPDPLSKFPP